MSGELEDFLATLPERAAADELAGVRVTYVFQIEDGDAWTVRVDGGKIEVEAGAGESGNCTFTASEETFSQLLGRRLDPLNAYLGGKLKISGDLGAAMLLQKMI